MSIETIAKREIKLGFRNTWSYSFLILFSLFSLALLSIQNQEQIQGYTHATGTMMNLTLYLLPLMTLLLGAFSVTSEKEEGTWDLLSTYSLSTASYLIGKFIGTFIVLFTIVLFSYGFSGAVGFIFGHAYSMYTLGIFLLFSFLLIILFLGVAIFIGSLSENRWQALTVSVGVWFFLVLGWTTFLISFLNWVPYMKIKPILGVLTLLNPAEFTRIFLVIKMGGGNIFGPEYYYWVQWMAQPSGTLFFFIISLLWLIASVGLAIFIQERRRLHG